MNILSLKMNKIRNKADCDRELAKLAYSDNLYRIFGKEIYKMMISKEKFPISFLIAKFEDLKAKLNREVKNGNTWFKWRLS